MKRISWTWWVFGVVVVLVIGYFVWQANKPKTELALFAECLKEKGAVFYGAFWCQHCTAQKKMFGKAAAALPYVECSTPDGRGQTQACTSKGVKAYPTWHFADGSIGEGVLSIDRLSEKTGCILAHTVL